MTAFDPDIDYPAPDSSHLLSEIGYVSLPPPDFPPDRPPASGSAASPISAARPGSPTPLDALQHNSSSPHGSSPDSQLTERFAPQWTDLLRRAVEEPGLINEAYSRFHGYSLGNRFAALIQCQLRGLEPGPINSFHGWRRLGYSVREGEHAISLCMPLKGVLAREKATPPEQRAPRDDPLPDIEEIEYIRAFVWKPHWFVFCQTQPLNPDNVQPLPTSTLNGWDQAQAFANLNMQELPFTELDGNVQGFARGHGVAVSPLAALPYKTLFHEMAHVVLGHTTREGNTDPLIDTLTLPRSIIEVEAEGTALLLLDTLDLPGQEYARGYIQHWLEGEAIPEKSAQRIFGAADRILSAGLGEGRTRSPTAEDLGWPPQMSPTPQAAQAEASAPLIGAPPIGGAPSAEVPADERLGETLTVRSGAEHAWMLHARLMRVHGELHPENRSERLSIVHAVRYLEHHDPEAAAQVRELVCHASLSLKLAFARLESALDGPLPAPVARSPEVCDQGTAPDGEVRLSPALSPALSPTREAAARRTVGRDLRRELQIEKHRFFETARAHDLKVGGKHEKAMLAALSEFLGVPVESRRTPSSRQWSLAASAIETEDLLW